MCLSHRHTDNWRDLHTNYRAQDCRAKRRKIQAVAILSTPKNVIAKTIIDNQLHRTFGDILKNKFQPKSCSYRSSYTNYGLSTAKHRKNWLLLGVSTVVRATRPITATFLQGHCLHECLGPLHNSSSVLQCLHRCPLDCKKPPVGGF